MRKLLMSLVLLCIQPRIIDFVYDEQVSHSIRQMMWPKVLDPRTRLRTSRKQTPRPGYVDAAHSPLRSMLGSSRGSLASPCIFVNYSTTSQTNGIWPRVIVLLTIFGTRSVTPRSADVALSTTIELHAVRLRASRTETAQGKVDPLASWCVRY